MNRLSVGSIESEEDELDLLWFQSSPGPFDIGKPVLRPNMRKLKHLTGVSLRNVNMKNGNDEKRAKTEQQRRASIVKWQQQQQLKEEEELSLIDNNNNTPSPLRSRRRATTIGSHNANVEIERTLQDINIDKLLDIAFILYDGNDELLYISEVNERSMNPEFKEIDFSEIYGRHGSQFQIVILGKRKPSSRQAASSNWQKIYSESINLQQDLTFVAKSPDSLRGPYSKNTLIVHLTDGCYMLSKMLPPSIAYPQDQDNGINNDNNTVTSCSYDMIMKLKTLEESTNDALVTIDKVTESSQPYLHPDTSFYIKGNQREQLGHKLDMTRNQIDRERRRKDYTHKQVKELKAKLNSRRLALSQARTNLQAQREQESEVRKEISTLQTQRESITKSISIERSRISDALQQIFPIDKKQRTGAAARKKSSGLPFTFTICELEITNSNEEETIGAAYGFTVQLVHLLSLYLAVPLRYPIQAFGSQSFIMDPISTIQGSRTFPLWVKGSLFYRFEYGVFLFQKDIEQLINSQFIDVIDLSQSLANLKNLLLVIAARGDF